MAAQWRSHCLADFLLCAFIALGLAAWRWERYRSDANPPLLSLADIGLLIGLLAAPILMYLLVGVLISLVLRLMGWNRVAIALLGAYIWSNLFWFVADVRVHIMTGRRLGAYAPYFLQPDVGEWGGGTEQIVTAAALLALATAAITVALLGFRHCLRSSLCRSSLCRHHVGWITVVLALSAMVAGRAYARAIAAGSTDLAKAVRVLNASAAEDQERLIARSPFGLAFSERMAPILEPMHRRLFEPAPPDAVPALAAANPPDIVLIVLESWRADALNARFMPRLSQISQSGLTTQQHYANSNRSEFGLFALLYGRSPAQYHQTLDRGIPPILCHMARAWGYRSLYVSGLRHQGFERMEQFIDVPGAFDEVAMLSHDEWGRALSGGDWPHLDRQVLRQVESRLQQADRPPLFAMAFLGSTHFPYRYPKEYERHVPVADDTDLWGRGVSQQSHEVPFRNRYWNALGFLDEEVGRFVDSIDLSRTIVIITGDHGESIWDDGTLAHSSRPSDVQCQVPFLLLAPKLQSRVIEHPTMHQDLLPTLEQLLAHNPAGAGRSLLAADSSGRMVLLVMAPPKPGPQELVLVTANDRMRIRLMEERPVARFLGFVGVDGAIDPALTPPVETVPEWVEQWEKALRGRVLPPRRD